VSCRRTGSFRHHEIAMAPIILFIAALVLVCAAVVGGGLWVARRIALKNSNAFVLKRFTKTGIVLALCQAVSLLLCFATWQLHPDGAFAALVSSPSGALGVLVLWLLAFAVANTVLTWLGFPSTAQQAARDV